MNLIESNAILVEIAHMALKAGLFTTFEQTNKVGQATEVAKTFVQQTGVDPVNGNFNPKDDFTGQDQPKMQVQPKMEVVENAEVITE